MNPVDKKARRKANRKAKAQGITRPLYLAECQQHAERKFSKLASLDYSPEARVVRKELSTVWINRPEGTMTVHKANQTEINAAKALLKGE
jgi:hypothetical protein